MGRDRADTDATRGHARTPRAGGVKPDRAASDDRAMRETHDGVRHPVLDAAPPGGAGAETAPVPTTLALSFAPGRVVAVLAGVAGLVVAAGVLSAMSRVVLGHGRLGGVVPLFNLDAEANVPAFFSALLLLACAACIAVLARGRRREGLPHARALGGLAALVGFLAVDEAAGVHELLSAPLRSALHLGGVLHYAWVAGYAAAAAVLLAVYGRLIPRLPRTVRRGVLAAAALYAASAVGMEMVAAFWVDSAGGTIGDAPYAAMTVAEESGEMAAVLVLLHTLLRAIRGRWAAVRLDLAVRPRPR